MHFFEALFAIARNACVGFGRRGDRCCVSVYLDISRPLGIEFYDFEHKIYDIFRRAAASCSSSSSSISFLRDAKKLIADRTGHDKRWAWHGGALKGICCSASCFSLDAPNKLSQKKLVQSNNLGRPLGLALLSVFLLLLFIS